MTIDPVVMADAGPTIAASLAPSQIFNSWRLVLGALVGRNIIEAVFARFARRPAS